MSTTRDRVAAAVTSALVGGILSAACVGKEPCSDADSGFAVVAIPYSLTDSVESITAEGSANCKLLTEVDDCDAGGCADGVGGVKVKRYYVSAAAEGDCTVIVRFSNGCPSKAVDLSFGGPSDNCCANTCSKGGSAQLPEDCQAD